jgi:hypothetical protein
MEICEDASGMILRMRGMSDGRSDSIISTDIGICLQEILCGDEIGPQNFQEFTIRLTVFTF